MKNQKGSVSSMAIVLFVLLLVGAVGFFVWQKTSNIADEASNTNSKNQNASTSANAKADSVTKAYKISSYTFEAPSYWTGYKENYVGIATMNVSGSLSKSTATISPATITIAPTTMLDIEATGGLYVFNKNKTTWDLVPSRPAEELSTKDVYVKFSQRVENGGPFLSVSYMRVLGFSTALFAVKEMGESAQQYSFKGTADSYPSNKLQNDIVSVLESFKK